MQALNRTKIGIQSAQSMLSSPMYVVGRHQHPTEDLRTQEHGEMLFTSVEGRRERRKGKRRGEGMEGGEEEKEGEEEGREGREEGREIRKVGRKGEEEGERRWEGGREGRKQEDNRAGEKGE